MGDLNLDELTVLRNLVADFWDEFVIECKEYEELDPEKLYSKLGGEPREH